MKKYIIARNVIGLLLILTPWTLIISLAIAVRSGIGIFASLLILFLMAASFLADDYKITMKHKYY